MFAAVLVLACAAAAADRQAGMPPRAPALLFAAGEDTRARQAEALRTGRLAQAVDEAAPAIPLYRRVMASLAE